MTSINAMVQRKKLIIYHANSIFIKRIPVNIRRKVHQNLGLIGTFQRRYMQRVT